MVACHDSLVYYCDGGLPWSSVMFTIVAVMFKDTYTYGWSGKVNLKVDYHNKRIHNELQHMASISIKTFKHNASSAERWVEQCD